MRKRNKESEEKKWWILQESKKNPIVYKEIKLTNGS